jgi:hypothetical protein
MKNWKNVKVNPGLKVREQVSAANNNPNAKQPEPVCAFTGLMQENYVNPAFLNAGMVANISNMSFVGLWL